MAQGGATPRPPPRPLFRLKTAVSPLAALFSPPRLRAESHSLRHFFCFAIRRLPDLARRSLGRVRSVHSFALFPRKTRQPSKWLRKKMVGCYSAPAGSCSSFARSCTSSTLLRSLPSQNPAAIQMASQKRGIRCLGRVSRTLHKWDDVRSWSNTSIQE